MSIKDVSANTIPAGGGGGGGQFDPLVVACGFFYKSQKELKKYL